MHSQKYCKKILFEVSCDLVELFLTIVEQFTVSVPTSIYIMHIKTCRETKKIIDVRRSCPQIALLIIIHNFIQILLFMQCNVSPLFPRSPFIPQADHYFHFLFTLSSKLSFFLFRILQSAYCYAWTLLEGGDLF